MNFEQLLEQYRVLIPMIQRDYAQGREDKKATEVRQKLLEDIFATDRGKPLFFDLIFGAKSNGNFIPIDGQQRLTMLFLLHLYQLKVLGSATSGVDLRRFTYDTRRASRDFVQTIVEKEWPELASGEKLSDAIKNRTWYLDYWSGDPTVASMLRVLDDIHIFAGEHTFPDLSKITFVLSDEIGEIKVSDDMYLKMNSRGLPLTPFENLKAAIDEMLSVSKLSEKDRKEWQEKIDNSWTELFWAEGTNKLNEHFSTFLIRMMSGIQALYGKSKEEPFKDIETEGEESFIPISVVKSFLQEVPEAFEIIRKALNIIEEINAGDDTMLPRGLYPYWSNEKDNWFAKADEIKEYPGVAAILSYVFLGERADEMRFAWNMIEHYVVGYETFILYCKILRKYKQNIESLGSSHQAIAQLKIDGARSRQLQEEVAKAKKICEDSAWREKIEGAEEYAFFHGAIRFLFTKEVIGDDWEDYDQKWEFIKNTFAQDADKTPIITEDYSTVMRHFMEQVPEYGILVDKRIYENSAVAWGRILRNEENVLATHRFLMGCEPVEIASGNKDNALVMGWLRNESLLSYLAHPENNIFDNSVRLRNLGDIVSLYKYRDTSGNGIALNLPLRGKTLARGLEKSKISLMGGCQRIPDTELFTRHDIVFRVNASDQLVLWNRYDAIVLLDEDWQWITREAPILDAEGNEQVYYAIYIDENNATEAINALISEYHNIIEKE